jgi:hypothetical protein
MQPGFEPLYSQNEKSERVLRWVLQVYNSGLLPPKVQQIEHKGIQVACAVIPVVEKI